MTRDELSVSIDDVQRAREPVEAVARRTPLVELDPDADLFLKLEALQRTGSFKLRGAWNRMHRIDEARAHRGFVTTSAGNHGRAVAWAARRLGAPCRVIVPDDAVPSKIDAMRALGAEVERIGHDELMEGIASGRWTDGEATFVHPFADAHVIAGQGTVGLELLEQAPEPGTVLIPVGGGGLASGVGTVVEDAWPMARLIGVQAAGSAPLAAAFEQGAPADVDHADTFADGIAVSRVFEAMWPLLQARLEDVLTVTDHEIQAAIARLARDVHVVAEGAGGAATAAAVKHRQELPEPIVCIVSGGNLQPSTLASVLDAHA